MPIGLRGVGKTVLLNRFAEIAEEEGMAVGFIEAPESGDFAALLAAACARYSSATTTAARRPRC